MLHDIQILADIFLFYRFLNKMVDSDATDSTLVQQAKQYKEALIQLAEEEEWIY